MMRRVFFKIRSSEGRVAIYALFLFLAMMITASAFSYYKKVNAQAVPAISGDNATDITDTSFNIRWTTDIPSNSNGYVGTAQGSYDMPWSGRCDAGGSVTDHCVSFTGLVSNTSYYYQIKSTTDDGAIIIKESTSAVQTTGSSATPPSAPSGLMGTQTGSGFVRLNWTSNSPEATSFKIKSRTRGTDTYIVSDTTTGNTSTYTETTTRTSGNYEYVVDACVGVVCSSDSPMASVIVDFTTPTSPTNLVATPVNTSRIDLSWGASIDTLSGIAGYSINRCMGASCTSFTQIATVATPGYSNVGLLPNTQYSYKISAYDYRGNTSEYTSVVSQSTQTSGSDTTPPSAPSLSGTAPSPTSITFTWSPSTDNVAVAGYRIYRTGYSTMSATTTATSYTDTSIVPGKSYSYTFYAFDATGNVSTPAGPASVTIPTGSGSDTIPPTVPASLVITGGTTPPLNISWGTATDNVGVAGYQLYRYGYSTMYATTSGTSYMDTSVLSGHGYYYRVSAFDTSGNYSALSAYTFVNVSGGSSADTIPPTVPTALVATPVNPNRIDLVWGISTDNTGVTGYSIYKNGMALTTVTSNYFSDTAVGAGTTQTYKVSARDAVGNVSAFSTEVSATTPFISTNTATTTGTTTITPQGGGNGSTGSNSTTLGAPSRPSITSLTSSSLTLAWGMPSGSAGVAGYRVSRYGYNTLSATTTGMTYYDTSISSGHGYYYQIYAFDSDGKYSAPSESTFVNIPGGIASSTAMATTTISSFTINNVISEMVFPYSARIRWTTNTPGDSLVRYGTIPGSPTQSSNDTSCGTAGSIVSHCIALNSLTPGVRYYYRAFSSGTNAILASSPEFSFAVPFTATTTAPNLTQTSTEIVPVQNPVSFKISEGTKSCAGNKTIINVTFSANPATGGTFIVSHDGIAQPAFTSKTITLESGAYTWLGLTNKGYVANGSTGGSLSLSSLPACDETNATTANQDNVVTEQPIQKPIPTPVSYAEAVKANETLISSSIPANATTEQKIQIVQTIAQSSSLAPQSENIQIGSATISRTDTPKQVMATTEKVIENRATSDLTQDTDGDGISDYDEIHIYGTDPKKADTNGDGVNDGDSLLAGIDPVKIPTPTQPTKKAISTEKILTPMTYENPKQVTVATTSALLTVDSLEEVHTKANDAKSPIDKLTFRGKALPNSYITIYVFSTPVLVTIKTDPEGRWEYTVDKELENGKHEIYVAMTQSSGKIVAKSSPIPFVKTTFAASLGSNIETIAGPPDISVQKGFLQNNLMMIFYFILAFVVAGGFISVGITAKQKSSQTEEPKE